MKNTRCLIALFLLLAISMLTACTAEKPQVTQPLQGTETTGEAGVRIGMIFDTFVVERWIRDRDAFLATASDLNATVDITNANGDIKRQEEMIRYYTEQGFDVIVIVAIDSSPLVRAVKDARAKGVKVISYDRLLRGAGTDLYVSFDNREVGRLMAEGVMEATDGPILLVLGSQSDNNTLLVEEGIREVLKEKGAAILDRTYIADWDAEEAARYTEEHLDLVREAGGIICGNDALAGSVIRTLSANRIELPVVTGQDADLDACQRIVEGTQYMTVYKPVHLLAQEAARYAVALAKEEEVLPAETLHDGVFSVPAHLLLPQAVYADNMEETVVDSGFHTRDEVWLNAR